MAVATVGRYGELMTASSSRRAGTRAFVSYPQEMEAQAAALQRQLGARGVPVAGSVFDQLDVDSQEHVAESIRDADLLVVLVPLQGSNDRRQQYEIGQILEAAWADTSVRVPVVAPAVRAIPPALRHRPFVLYYAHSQVRLDTWASDTAAVDLFVDALLHTQDNELPPQEVLADEEIREWRNRLVHIGRGEVDRIPGGERDRLLDGLRADLDSAWRAFDAGEAWNPQRMLDRILLASALDEPELAKSFYRLITPTDLDKDLGPTELSADIAYSRALAAMEVGDYGESVVGFQRAAGMNEHLRGAADPRTVASQYNGALAAAQLGDLETAQSLYERALESALEGLGEHHPQTAAIAFNLAGIHASRGDIEEARRLLRLAEDAWEQVTPADSPELANVRSELQRLGA